DDFKFGTSVASCDVSIRMAFIRKVYLILLTQILTTTAVGATMYTQPSIKAWVQSNQWMMIVAVIGSFVSLFTLFAVRHKYPANFYALAGFTLVEAYTIGVATSFYDARVVLQALFLTAGLFIALTLFTFQTKIDFVSWGGFLYMALWALILVGLVGMFSPHGKTFELVYASLGTLLFCGYTIYDTQLLLKHHSVDEYIVASVSLYLDVLNLFLNILRLL
ncbi:inhibitor of apoptosis-promoting Bax1-domain-containing protein, partial [Protomyces lactucae-debilis]